MWAAEARENMKGRVLVVSDNLPAAIGVRRKLLPLQYRVHVAGRADDALSLLHTQRIRAVLVDPALSDPNVQWLHERIAARHPKLIPHVIWLLNGDLPPDVATFVEATGNDTTSLSAGGAKLDAVLSRHLDGGRGLRAS
jgi:DNA-binding response OmpR family regulator